MFGLFVDEIILFIFLWKQNDYNSVVICFFFKVQELRTVIVIYIYVLHGRFTYEYIYIYYIHLTLRTHSVRFVVVPIYALSFRLSRSAPRPVCYLIHRQIRLNFYNTSILLFKNRHKRVILFNYMLIFMLKDLFLEIISLWNNTYFCVKLRNWIWTFLGPATLSQIWYYLMFCF